MYGPKGPASPIDFCFDLHNSTSNTGVLLCMHQKDALAHEIAAYLFSLDNKIRVAHWSGSGDQPYLPSLTKSGMTVEIGPVMHGTVNYSLMEKAKHVLVQALAYLEFKHQAPTNVPTVQVTMPVGERYGEIDFPRDTSGDLRGFVHPKLQFIPEMQPGSHLVDGQPLFVNVHGKVLQSFEAKAGDLLLYPLFVNELAYNEKGVAMYLNALRDVTVSILANAPPSKF